MSFHLRLHAKNITVAPNALIDMAGIKMILDDIANILAVIANVRCGC